MATQLTHYINGKRVAGTSGRSAPVFNPATGAESATVDLASKAEVRAAVESASAVAAEWAATTPLRRARILNKFLGILEDRSEELAAAITAEHGKVLSDALGEVTRGIEVVELQLVRRSC